MLSRTLLCQRQDRPVELGKALAAKKVELLSTGGTAKTLRAAGLQVQDVADYTASKRCWGRVKRSPQGARRHHVRARQRRYEVREGGGH